MEPINKLVSMYKRLIFEAQNMNAYSRTKKPSPLVKDNEETEANKRERKKSCKIN